MNQLKYPVTPDGRYFVVRGRLWRATSPHLKDSERLTLTTMLMAARSAVKQAKRNADDAAEAAAHADVDAAKIALGERGPVWWTDGAPDYSRKLARNTPYASWYLALNLPETAGKKRGPAALEDSGPDA